MTYDNIPIIIVGAITIVGLFSCIIDFIHVEKPVSKRVVKSRINNKIIDDDNLIINDYEYDSLS